MGLMYYYDIRGGIIPLSELGPPIPSPASECVPTPGTKGGGNTRQRMKGRADPIWTTRAKAWHSVWTVGIKAPLRDIV